MRKKLLLADDSVTIQRVIELTFADEPVDVLAVGDGAAAIARLEAEPPDVVLADIGMPGQDGYAVAKHVRETPALAHIPVILLTGAFDPVDHARVREAGCTGVVVKPFDPQLLVARVRSLLDGQPGVRPAGVPPQASETAVSSALPPAEAPWADAPGAPEARAIVVDEYFEQLDRAFAALGARQEDARAPGAAVSVSAWTGNNGPTPAGADEPTGTTDTTMRSHRPFDAGGAPAGSDGAPASERSATSDGGPPAFRPAPSEVDPATLASSDVPVRQALDYTAPPSLSDAFAALLALERGKLLPAQASRFASLLTAADVARIAERVSREISERVLRGLAPEIVAQVAERVVRQEVDRLIARSPDR